ncbi:MAG: EAL domain-containing protein [Cyanobacteria bacterium]|nr:EAL domain-containing protein [Cyanobacteriota bacterium]MDW8201235.1 EAL domain-containing protein [Cyanobacteriota bacterium SKYGB_h_bin112]
MNRQPPLNLDQIPSEDWEHTPDSIKYLVEDLLAQTMLPSQDQQLRQFLDASPIGIAVHYHTGQIIYINDAGRVLLGIDRSVELRANLLSEIFQVYREGTDIPYPLEELPSSRALTGEAVWADDLEVRTPQRVLSLEVWASPIVNDEGQVTYAVVVFQDISDRKQREMEQRIISTTLAENKRHRRHVIEVQTDLILQSLPDTTIIFANDAVCNALQRPHQQVLGLKWSDFVPPEDLVILRAKVADLTPEQPTFESINRNYRASGQTSWTQWVNLGIFDDQRQLVKIQSVGRDITALQAQILREQALNRVFQAIRNSLDLETIFTTAVRETAQLLDKLDCFVVQYLPAQGVWKPVAQFCHDGRPSMRGMEIPDAGNPFADRLKQLQLVRLEDTSDLEDAINQEVARSLPGAWLLIPLVVNGSIWGSFTITTPEHPFYWQDEQVTLAQAVAEQLEVAIHQANLYKQLQLELAERQQVETALRESEARFQNMAANVPGVILRYILHPDGTDGVLYMSAGCARLWEVEAQAVVEDASILWGMVHPEDLPIVRASVIASAQTLQPWFQLCRITTPSGREKWLEAAGRPTRQANGDIIWDTLILDVTARIQAEAARRESEARYRLLAENTNDLVCLHNVDGRYLYISPSCETLLGYHYDEMLGQDPYTFCHPDDRDRVRQEAHRAAMEGKSVRITYRMLHKAGHYLWFETLTKPIADASGQVVQIQTTSRDVTERVLAQQQLEYDAYHDALTGLPNRQLMMERLTLAVNRAQQSPDYHFAVLFLDLDRFKVINDSLGHLAGDQLLVAIAQRLQAVLHKTDLVARLGGDEFVILLDDIHSVQEAIRVTERLFTVLQTPFELQGREVYTSCSIGIVFGTSNYTQASELLRDADIAMYQAKGKSRARYEIFNTEMHIQALNRLHLENDLRRAIDCQEFVLYYQPIVALNTGTIVGLEALIRWQHPIQGLKRPSTFISVAEDMGFITQLDYWVLQTACHQLATWQARSPHLSRLKISVNLCAQDLNHSDLLSEIDRALATTGIDSQCLTLEITESMLINDVEVTIDRLHQLKARGVQISIDDFGTGYSSLSYLHQLPINSLKVDRSFVQQIESGQRNRQLVETIAALSQQLELEMIAEGIETQQQFDRLQQLGYQYGQGYWFSRPLAEAEATTLLLRG